MNGQPARCHSCLAEHPTGAGFGRSKGQVLCSLCLRTKTDRKAARQGLMIWLVLIATVLAWVAEGPRLIRVLLTYMSSIWLVAAAMVVIHEAGHAFAALALGVRVRGVELGSQGPVIASFSRGLFTLTLRLFPIGGLTRLDPAQRAIRSRHIVIAAAGPLTEAALVVAALIWRPTEWLTLTIKSNIVAIGAVSILFNLLIPLRGQNNDGSNIRKLLTMADDEIDALAGIGDHDEVVRRLNAHMTGEPLPANELEEIRKLFTARLQHPGLAESSRALESNNLAAVNLTIDDPSLLEEADEMSRSAYELLPIPETMSTRGSALVALGRYAEGAALLERALPGLKADHTDSTRANLALAALHMQDVFGARNHLAAMRTAPNVPAYHEARRLMGPAEVRNAIAHYWSSGQSADDVAARISADAGPVANLIGRNITESLNTLSPSDLAHLFAEHAAIEISPDEARHGIAALAETLMSYSTRPPSRDGR